MRKRKISANCLMLHYPHLQILQPSMARKAVFGTRIKLKKKKMHSFMITNSACECRFSEAKINHIKVSL